MTRRHSIFAAFVLAAALTAPAGAQSRGTVPTFQRNVGANVYTFAGRDPAKKGTTTIPTVIVPVTLTFAGKAARLNADPDAARILQSPIFSEFDYGPGENTQYADGLLHATFPADKDGHTLLKKTEAKPLTIDIPPGYGYLLSSKSTGRSFGVVDQEFLEREIFSRIPRQDGKLILAVTHNATYYADADATVCCTWGTHGVDSATGNSFVLSTYIAEAPAIVRDRDVQPITQQLAEFFNDPLHDPKIYFHTENAPGNYFVRWVTGQDESGCGGGGIGSNYFLLEPTDTNPKNNFPSSPPHVVAADGRTFHLQNVALLPWYLGAEAPAGSVFSFPDREALTEPAKPCPSRASRTAIEPTATPAPSAGVVNGHKLIGYWTGSRYGKNGAPFPLRNVAPQWDAILVAFAPPKQDAAEGTLFFEPPQGITPAELKADIADAKAKGKTVMLSLGGGGQFFKLDNADSISNFVSSVTQIVADYGFEGVDIDFESPSLVLAPGDTDFRHPTTSSIVNLIAGLRQLHGHFGSGFKISLVPEGSQIPAGFVSYGGQFGSYLPLVYGLRDLLTFVDVQDYNTPPLEGLDGEIYQSSSVDYHAAMTELLLHGFDVGGDPAHHFPAVSADKVAVGFLTGYATPELIGHAMNYLVTGKASTGVRYRLRQPAGYPSLMGAMFWTIDDDRRDNYRYSNLIGPQLHDYPKK